jgi:hypothetical protein
MDAGTFVQENKRWLIGCALGAVVFFVGKGVIGSAFDANSVAAEARALTRNVAAEVYDQKARDAAREEAEQLAARRGRVQQELAFVQTPKFLLAGKGNAEDYLFQLGRSLRTSVLNAANERDIQLDDKTLVWAVPTSIDEIRGVLFGLELLDEAAQRLFAAHDAVRADDVEAMGVRAITMLRVESRQVLKAQSRSNRPGEIDVGDLLEEERLALHFQSDAATAAAFCAACRKPGRTLVVDAWTLQAGARPGEPVSVKASLSGIAFKPPKEN